MSGILTSLRKQNLFYICQNLNKWKPHEHKTQNNHISIKSYENAGAITTITCKEPKAQ
jgi:hypothetical protein